MKNTLLTPLAALILSSTVIFPAYAEEANPFFSEDDEVSIPGGSFVDFSENRIVMPCLRLKGHHNQIFNGKFFYVEMELVGDDPTQLVEWDVVVAEPVDNCGGNGNGHGNRGTGDDDSDSDSDDYDEDDTGEDDTGEDDTDEGDTDEGGSSTENSDDVAGQDI